MESEVCERFAGMEVARAVVVATPAATSFVDAGPTILSQNPGLGCSSTRWISDAICTARRFFARMRHTSTRVWGGRTARNVVHVVCLPSLSVDSALSNARPCLSSHVFSTLTTKDFRLLVGLIRVKILVFGSTDISGAFRREKKKKNKGNGKKYEKIGNI